MQDLQQRNEQAKEALTAAFRIMDEDRSGNINHLEFLQTLKMLHYGIERGRGRSRERERLR